MPKYRVCMNYIIDIPDEELEDARGAVAEISDDAQWFIDQYARESYCSMVERMDKDE